MKHELGDAPIQEEYRQKMVAIVKTLDEFLNGDARGEKRETGFVLMVFPFGSKDGRCNYISNGADRDDVVCLMKEMIARFQDQPEMTGNA